MVYISEIAVKKIKSASNTGEVRQIIDRYIERLQGKHGGMKLDRKYTTNILLTLEYHKSKEVAEQARNNLINATEIFKKHHVNAIDFIL